MAQGRQSPGSAAPPVRGPKAFERGDRDAVLAQAAILLQLGRYLRGDDVVLAARARAAPALRAIRTAVEGEDRDLFPVPVVRASGQRFRPADVSRMRLRAPTGRPGGAAGLRRELAQHARRLYRTPTPETAATLLEASLGHPELLTRVAAAWAYLPLAADPARLLDVLQEGAESPEALTRDVAATALARVAPGHPALARLAQSPPEGGPPVPSRTGTIVHGTWASGSDWWKPEVPGDFFSYVKASVDGTLYAGGDRFAWSGGYSDAARALGAADLKAWVEAHRWNASDLFTHSHGGSVAMLASQNGMAIGRLVLLSCPVHVPEYLPDFSRVGNVVSVRVHFDLVILADGGGQRFRDPNIDEHVLPVWFDHSATHDPGVWKKHDVPGML
jgi:hypothetical protein